MTDLPQQVEELAAREAIRQLACRYAATIDARDFDALADCFVEDVRHPPGYSGREGVKQWASEAMREIRSTVHFVGNHLIELDGPDRAKGIVYCRAEHEYTDQYLVVTLQYWDEYERVDGRWYFRSRYGQFAYATDVLTRPIGAGKVQIPGTEPQPAALPDIWPTAAEFYGVAAKDFATRRGFDRLLRPSSP